MQNFNLGLWQGMKIGDVRHKQPKVYRQWQEQPENVCPPEGEMIEQAQERIAAAMTRLLRKHKDGVIGLVIPEPLASLVRAAFQARRIGRLVEGPRRPRPLGNPRPRAGRPCRRLS